jgi:hypothetical protein
MNPTKARTKEVPRIDDAVPTIDATAERPRAIVLPPQDEGAHAEPTVVWVGEPGGVAPGPPPQVIACTAEMIAAWLQDGVPSWLWSRRTDGVLVQYDASASARTRQAARALRERLAPRTAAGLTELAELADLPTLAAALSRMPPHHVPTFADLARGLAHAGDPQTRRTARLLWALEHL